VQRVASPSSSRYSQLA